MEFQIYAIKDISIHALREEGDFSFCRFSARLLYFYPRPPRGGRLSTVPAAWSLETYFYPRPPRGGRRGRGYRSEAYRPISIHALREEGDLRRFRPCGPADQISIHALREEGDTLIQSRLDETKIISIHALREEGDLAAAVNSRLMSIFLSTPSARRATLRGQGQQRPRMISIHALREEGDVERSFNHCRVIHISIHALREEGDSASAQRYHRSLYFYPRPPRGGRHVGTPEHEVRRSYFYPRPPRGGRQNAEVRCNRAVLFLSTPSARRATSLASGKSRRL